MNNDPLDRYGDLFVECNDPNVQRLYFLLRLFFAKCDRLIPNADVRRQMGEVSGIPFDPYVTPPSRRDQILARLRLLKRHRISGAREIVSILTWGLFATEGIKLSDRKYLVAFVENTGKPFTQIAKELGVTSWSAYEAYKRLKARIQFRYGAFVNYPLLKLHHYILFFKPNDDFQPSALEREFTLTLNRDTFTDWMWATFLVPRQERMRREFTDGVKALSQRVFEEHRLYEAVSYGKSYNLALFDGEKWVGSEEALAVGAIRFSEQISDTIVGEPPVFNLVYAPEPMRFDDIDYLLTFLKFGDARISNAELRSTLRGYGHDLSWETVSHRVSRLVRENAFIPAPNFSGLGLTAASMFAIECDDAVTRTLCRALPYFPECAAICRTDRGVVFMVRGTPDAMPTIAYMIRGALRDRAERVIIAVRLENMGSKNPISLHNHWKSDKQYWSFERRFFDLSKNSS